MKQATCLITAAASLGAALLGGCSSFEGREGAIVGGAVGALGGAAIGSAAAGKDNRGTGAVVGAVVGGVGGAVAGDQFYDKKDK